ncbi:MAG: amidohydrolase family protein [Candidatus Dormibacteraeota bacterium]|nr:amidohydrolase family protein [Candidatus Dormibacteraeota bacterium]
MTEVTALFADALYDPETAETQRHVAVVVQDGRITAAGPRDQVQVPADAERIDAEGLTLLPGLIDLHVHLCTDGHGMVPGEILATPPSLATMEAARSCRLTLDAGFTTVRDAGGTPHGVRMAVEQGHFPGPRMQLAVQVLSQTGGHADNHFPCGVTLAFSPLSDLPSSIVDGEEAMQQRVRELIRNRADWIKLCTSGGVLSPGDSPHHATFTLGEIKMAVRQAATQGRRVMAHAQAARGVKNALLGGVTTIEHGIWLDDEAIELFGDDRILVPTLVAPQWIIRHSESGRMPDWAAEKSRLVMADHVESFKKAVAAGVRVAFGTDTGVGPHGTNGEELLLMRDAGMDAATCIRAATTDAARVLRWEGRVGTLRRGAFGDVIGVAGDPREHLELLAGPKTIELVVKGGQVVKERETANV